VTSDKTRRDDNAVETCYECYGIADGFSSIMTTHGARSSPSFILQYLRLAEICLMPYEQPYIHSV